MKSWVDQLKQLTCTRVTKKETENLKIDKRWNSDLSKLKYMGVHLFQHLKLICVWPKKISRQRRKTLVYISKSDTPVTDVYLFWNQATSFGLSEHTKTWAYKNLSTSLKIYFEKVETNSSATRMGFLARLEKLTQWMNIFGNMNNSNIISCVLKLYTYLYT